MWRVTGYSWFCGNVSALSFKAGCPQLLFFQGNIFSGHLSMPSSQKVGKLQLESSWYWGGTAPEGRSLFSCRRRGKKLKHQESKSIKKKKKINLRSPRRDFIRILSSFQFTLSILWTKGSMQASKKKPRKNFSPGWLHLRLHLLPVSVYAWWVTSVYGTLFLQDLSLNLCVFWGRFFWRVWMLFKGWKCPLGKFSCQLNNL